MTLREQIKDIHRRNFNPDFHAYRGDLIAAMVNDLKLKLFDELTASVITAIGGDEHDIWCLSDSQDIRAIRRAAQLISRMELRADTPGVE